MRTVRVREPVDGTDADVDAGDRYLLLKASDDACLVRNPRTGRRRYLPADALERVDAPPVDLDADTPRPLRALAARDGRLGLLLDVVARRDTDDPPRAGPATADTPGEGAVPVRTLLDETSLCESDLHGALADLEAAGLLERVEPEGPLRGRAYRPTERALTVVETLRS